MLIACGACGGTIEPILSTVAVLGVAGASALATNAINRVKIRAAETSRLIREAIARKGAQ